MSTVSMILQKHHQGFIVGLTFIIVFFALACTFHDVIPICH